jgi:hypothetical protein
VATTAQNGTQQQPAENQQSTNTTDSAAPTNDSQKQLSGDTSPTENQSQARQPNGKTGVSGTMELTAEPHHPEIDAISLGSPESQVVQPGAEATLAIDLTTDHGLTALDQLNVTLYRSEVSPSNVETRSQSEPYEHYQFTVAYDTDGAATITSPPDQNLNLDPQPIAVENTNDTAEIDIRLPEKTRPTINSAYETINQKQWVIAAEAMNTDILHDEPPTTAQGTTEISVNMGVTVENSALQFSGNSLPGTDNIPLTDSTGDQKTTIEVTGNVETNLKITLDKLTHTETGTTHTIEANEITVATGSKNTTPDSPTAQSLTGGTAPIITPTTKNTLKPGDTVTIKLWGDIPNGTVPGTYTGQFDIVVSESPPN